MVKRMMQFGKMLANIRGRRRLSLRELGKLADMDPAWIHRIEVGSKLPTTGDTLRRIIIVLKPTSTERTDLIEAYSRAVAKKMLG